MNLKIALGIIIPLVVIVLLVIIGRLPAGTTVDEVYVEEISIADISTTGQIQSTIKIADINIKNEYFLGKRISLPRLGICLDDIDGIRQRTDVGSITYSEGDTNPGDDPLNEIIVSTYSSVPDSRSVQVGSDEEKIVRVFLTPSYKFRNDPIDDIIDQYGDYDRLVVFDLDDSKYANSRYYYCNDLNQEAVDRGTAIPIVA